MEARIAGIKKVKIIDRAKELEKQPKRISWTVYLVSSLTFCMIILLVFLAIPESIRETKTIRRYLSHRAELPKCRNKSDYLQFIRKELSYVATGQKRRLIRLLEEQKTDTLNTESQKLINDKIILIIREGSGARPATVMLLILSAIGIWYVLSSIL